MGYATRCGVLFCLQHAHQLGCMYFYVRGCVVMWQDGGTTPLYLASQEGHDAVVRALLDGGAAINQTTVCVVGVSGGVVGVAGWALWAGDCGVVVDVECVG